MPPVCLMGASLWAAVNMCVSVRADSQAGGVRWTLTTVNQTPADWGDALTDQTLSPVFVLLA